MHLIIRLRRSLNRFTVLFMVSVIFLTSMISTLELYRKPVTRMYDETKNCSITAVSSDEPLLSCTAKLLRNKPADDVLQKLIVDSCKLPENPVKVPTCKQLLRGLGACDVEFYFTHTLDSRSLSLDFGLKGCKDSPFPAMIMHVTEASLKEFQDDVRNAYNIKYLGLTRTNMTYKALINLVNSLKTAEAIRIHNNLNLKRLSRSSFLPNKNNNLRSLIFTMNGIQAFDVQSIVLSNKVEELIIKDFSAIELASESIGIDSVNCGPQSRSIEIEVATNKLDLETDFIKLLENQTCASKVFRRSNSLKVTLNVPSLDDGVVSKSAFSNLLRGCRKHFVYGEFQLPDMNCCSPHNDWLFRSPDNPSLQLIKAKCKDINETLDALDVELRALRCNRKLELDTANFNRTLLYIMSAIIVALILSLFICFYCIATKEPTEGSRMSAMGRSRAKTKRSSHLGSRHGSSPRHDLIRSNSPDKILLDAGRLKSRPSVSPSEAAFLAPHDTTFSASPKKDRQLKGISTVKSVKSTSSVKSINTRG